MSPARPPLPPGPWAVVGLARSGLAAARALRARGETVVGIDAHDSVPAAQELAALGVRLVLGGDGVAALAGVRALVKSPGVPAAAGVIAAARERRIAVIGELELAWRLLPNPFLAVTGSNGKTTTTELIGHVHRLAGVAVAVAGNVGEAVSGLADEVGADVVIACECSSFQLEDAEAFAPDAALLVNLAEDHLDRHGTLDAYRAAKLRVFAQQGESQLAVLPSGWRDPTPGAARRVTFGPGGDAALVDGVLCWRGAPVLPVAEIRLRGNHNLENAAAAAALCLARGLDPEVVAAGLRTFAGVPHRLEEVATRDGVLYVNDSKATNVEAASTGLRAFTGGVHAILGGRAKGGGFAGLAKALREHAVAAYLIGEAAAALAEDLAATGIPLHRSGDLEHALGAARAAARPGEVVLLSPACASFDQYADYEERGRHFRELVQSGG